MSARIFVGNLNPRTTETQLARFFVAAGEVVSVKLVLDAGTGESRGFGFVEFGDREQAERALMVYQGRELAGRRLRLAWAKPREERSRRERAAGSNGRGEGARGRPWLGDLDEDRDEDYSRARESHRRHGKHGSDRRRARGTRRVIV